MADSTTAQHLHDYRVNKTRGHEVRGIARWCIHCKADARPRYLYCSDACAEASRAETIAVWLQKGDKKRG